MSIIISLLILGTVIFVHELGHFLVAKAVKAPVYKFAVGMGPILYAKTINGTEYSLRWIPLGGFVQLELEEELENEGDSAFRRLSILKRGGVYLAGAVFNFILAFILLLGISFSSGYPSTTIGEISNNSPSQKQGLQIGDTVLSIDDNQITSWNEIPYWVTNSNGKELSFEIKRDNEIKTILITPEVNEGDDYYTIGISPEYKKDLMKSIEASLYSTAYNIKATFKGLVDIFAGMFNSNHASENELSGPIGTIQTMSSQSKQGFLPSLMLVISITISLGVFNLLPIPGLDGGKIVFLFIEFLRGGKKMSIERETQITMIGLVLLMGLMLIATKNDIAGLF